MIFWWLVAPDFQGRIHQCKDVIPIDPSTDLWFAEFTLKLRANASYEFLETDHFLDFDDSYDFKRAKGLWFVV